MNYIFNISQIRDIENHLFTNHIQPYELMKRAGDEAFNIIKHQYPHSTDLTIFCGKGNNAGDAYIIAMKALSEGYCVTIIELYEQLSQLATQARNELKALQKCPDLKFIKYNSNNKITIDEQSIIIDAIFGIGFKGKIKEPEESAFHLINNSANKVVAIDIASGLDADTGKVESIAVKADITISFIAAKFGLFLEDGKDHIGELHIANLGTPKEVFDRFNNHHQLLNFDYLKQFIPQRKSSDHKGSHGHALLIGGLEDMPGAIIMSAKSCYRMGVGKVTIITQRKNYAIIAASLPEAMFQDIDEIVKDSCNFAEFTQQFSIITIGPGLSQSAIAKQILQKTLALKQLKLIDADALNLIAQHYPKQKLNNAIITPHIKEAARLLNVTTSQILQDRSAAIKQLCDSYNVTSILKSESCFIKANNDETIFISPYGNKSLAKAGTGDVLTGIISGLLAQKIDALMAVQLGIVIHGKASDIFVKRHNYQSLLAGDLIDELKNL